MTINRRRYMDNKDLYRECLSFKALRSGTFTLTIGSDVSTTNLEYIEYSLDEGKTWFKTDNVNGETVVITTPTIDQDEVVYWKGKGLRMSTSNATDATKYSRFTATANFEASGNIMSLLYEKWNKATSVNTYAFAYLFYNNTRIKTAPEFPATTVAAQCYNNTFRGCTNLVTGPSILPALTLASNCYIYMFRDCSSLNYIKALFTTTPSSTYTSAWVQGVSSSGTFVKNSAATWTNTGVSSVPSGWTVETASE